MDQVRIDFLVTANMSGMHKQVQALNAELMQTAGTVNLLDKNLSKLDVMSAHRQFGQMVTSSGMFDHQIVSLDTHTKQFADSLSRARLTGRQYWQESMKYMRGARGEIAALAREQVRMQNSVLTPLGRGPGGQMTGGVTTPTGLPTDMATGIRVANKEWEIFNKTAQQGATHMVNWGKNTQWAGRQLMVGFTVPLMIAGGLAAKTFKDLDEQLVRLTKVYGSGFTFGDEYAKQAEVVREAGMKMAEDMARAYGQAGEETIALMADLAAVGLEGQDLARMTEQTTRLATLGEVDRQQAMDATISMQTAFKMSTEEVATSVNFLNAVENQTSATLSDLTDAIPRAGTVVKALGGDMQDLSLYMVAFREGGISAAEGANALKSGLSSIIAPPKAAVEFLQEFGINLPKIVNQNAGDLTGTILEFQKSLMGLDKLAQQQVITKLFGKYQFARMSAFFNNLGAKGSQTLDVMKLMGVEASTLQKAADQEIRAGAESASGQWKRQWEAFRVTIANVGKEIMGWGTNVLKVLNKVFGFIADNDWLLNIIKYGGLALATIGPIVMMMGLFGNIIGTVLKGVLRLVNSWKVLNAEGGGIKRSFEMMTAESFAADQGLDKLTQSMYDQTTAMQVLEQSARQYVAALESIGVASAGVISPSERIANISMGSDVFGAPVGSAALGATPERFVGGHFLPRSVPGDDAEQAMWRKRYVEAFGFTGEERAGVMAGTHYPHLAGLGYGMVSREQNTLAGNNMPFFIQDRGIMEQKTLFNGPEGKAAAGHDADLFFQHMREGFQREGADLQRNADNRRKFDQMELEATTMIGNKMISAEQTFINIMAMVEQLAMDILPAGSTVQGRQGRVITTGGRYRGDRNDTVAASLTSTLGAAGSTTAADQKALGAALKATTAQVSEMGVEAQATSVKEQRYGLMIDKAAQVYEIDAKNLQADVSQEQAEAAMTRLSNQAGDTTLDFELVQDADGRYIVAMDRLTKETVGVAQQIKNGSFRALPGAAPTVNAENRAVPLDYNNAKAQVKSAIDQVTVEAEKRAGIEKKSTAEAQKRTQLEREASAAQRKLATEQRAQATQTAAIMKQNMTYEMKVAQLRRQGLLMEDGRLVIEGMELTTEQQKLVEEFKQLEAEKLQTVEDRKQAVLAAQGGKSAAAGAAAQAASWKMFAGGGGSVNPKTGGGIMPILGKLKPSSSMLPKFGGAALAAGMLSMFVPETENSVINGAKSLGEGAMYGAMAGSVIPGLGTGIGAVAGLAISGGMMAWDALSSRSDEAAAEAAAKWEEEFGQADLSGAIDSLSEALGIKDLNKPVTLKINLTGDNPLSGVSSSKKISDAVTATFGEEGTGDIAKINAMENPTEYVRGIYAQLIKSGYDPNKAKSVIAEILRQSSDDDVDQSRFLTEIISKQFNNAKDAGKFLIRENKKNLNDALNELFTYEEAGLNNMRIESVYDDKTAKEAGKRIGSVFAQSFEEKVSQGLIKGPKQIEDFYTKSIDSVIQKSAAALTKNDVYEGFRGNINEVADAMGISVDQFESLAESPDLLIEKIRTLPREQLDAVRGMMVSNSEMAESWHIVEQASVSVIDSIKATDPALGQMIEDLMEAEGDAIALAAAMREVRAGAFEAAGQTKLIKLVNKALPDQAEPVNLNKMERQQQREMDALQESEDAKLEALQDAEDKRLEQMQNAADKRERLIEKETKQTERAYDKEIRQIENAEAKRQEQMQAEEDRFARKQEMRNLGISYDEAVAGGDLFEAARIRMDINATRKQQERDTAEERRQKKVDKRVKALEKEKNAKVRVLNQELRAEQKANEKMIESAQEASQAKIEAAQEASEAAIAAAEKANRQELKDQKQKNKEIEDNQKDLNVQISKLADNLMNGQKKKFMDGLEELGITAAKASRITTKWVSDEFGYLPGKILKKIVDGVAAGDWGLLDRVMSMATAGTSPKEIKSIFDFDPNTGNAGTGDRPGYKDDDMFLATGGYVSGPGHGTSDSIPARLSNGEYVVKSSSVAKYGKGMLDSINSGDAHIQHFASGGMVSPIVQGILRVPMKMIQHGFKKKGAGGGGTFAAPSTTGSGKHLVWIPSSGNDEVVDSLTAAQLRIAGGILGHRMYVTQGSYENYTSYSGSTHTGGGVVDVPGRGVFGSDVVALQKAGFAAWYRGSGAPNAEAASYEPHIHAVSLFSKNLDPNAALQRGHYINMSGDGLGNPYYGPHVAPMPGLKSRLPGLRSGGRINYDNTLANLHRGETVLTAPLTKKLENNIASGGSTTYNVDVTVNNPTSNVDVERAIENWVSNRERKLGRNRVIR